MSSAINDTPIDSSIFGQAPGDWRVDRIRDRLCGIVGGEWGDDPDAHDDGVEVPVIRVADIRDLDLTVDGLTIRRIKESKLAGRLIDNRTILIEKSGGGENNPVGRAVRTRMVTCDAICSNFMAKIDCGDTINPSFIVYTLDALYSCGVNGACIQQTTGIQNLRVLDYLNTKVAFPDRSEQHRIASYLDKTCATIDTAIEKKQMQLETLDALRKSIIHKAVTRGLDDSVELKDSGVEYLERIPLHWKVDRLKDIVSLRNSKTDESSEAEDYLELEDIEQGTGNILSQRNTLDVESAVTIFKKGDVLFGKLRPYLEKYYLADFDGKCTGEILAFEPIRIRGQFLLYCIASPWFLGQCNMLAYGAKMPRVNWPTQLAKINIPLPPDDEQDQIAAYLDVRCDEMIKLKKNINAQIATLEQYRKSLIHECVTGKRRITEAHLKEIEAHV